MTGTVEATRVTAAWTLHTGIGFTTINLCIITRTLRWRIKRRLFNSAEVYAADCTNIMQNFRHIGQEISSTKRVAIFLRAQLHCHFRYIFTRRYKVISSPTAWICYRYRTCNDSKSHIHSVQYRQKHSSWQHYDKQQFYRNENQRNSMDHVLITFYGLNQKRA